uniref:HAD family hydrolase n=1 Tax=Oscillatoriales cyanobacterium SpSt-402 TaxID=2282168 RepID=A0A832M3I6_9CYAN
MKVIIFDFDGTIADSFEAVLKISNQLAAEFGYPKAQPEDISRLKNLSSREVVRQSKVSPFKLPFLLRRLRYELNQEIHRLKPIPGMKSALLRLKQQGNQLGIVTSNSCENVAAFLEAQELSDVFDFVGSGLALFGKGRVIQRILKQHQLNHADVIYVGDETRDIEAARKIGIQVIAVSWGFNSSQALAAEKPDFLIHQPEELLEVVV